MGFEGTSPLVFYYLKLFVPFTLTDILSYQGQLYCPNKILGHQMQLYFCRVYVIGVKLVQTAYFFFSQLYDMFVFQSNLYVHDLKVVRPSLRIALGRDLLCPRRAQSLHKLWQIAFICVDVGWCMRTDQIVAKKSGCFSCSPCIYNTTSVPKYIQIHS